MPAKPSLVFGLAFLAWFLSGCSRDSAPGTADASRTPQAAGAAEGPVPPGPPHGGTAGEGPIDFVERAERSGIDFTYRNGEEAGRYWFLETLGGGVAVLDYDGDGQPDLMFAGGGDFEANREIHGRPPGLYRNHGDWRFAEATQPAGVNDARHYSHGLAVADYNADGFPDVLATGYGGLLLYRNQGDGTFQEVAAESGLTDTLWSTSAAWGDLNGDGHVDLYVAHYVDWTIENDQPCYAPHSHSRDTCPPRVYEPLPDVCYFNNGDGTFRDATHEAGLLPRRPDDYGKGLGVVMADLHLEGHLDIYVGNDTTPNFLYRNLGEGRFEDTGMLSGAALGDTGRADGSMGVDVGDFDGDGLPDLWVANYEREAFALYRNEGSGLFRHVSRRRGVTAVGDVFVGWGTAFFDADRDGDEDIVVANGHVLHHPVNAPVRQLPLLFQNQDGNRYVNVAPTVGDYLSTPHQGRGLALGDLDGDGALDLVISHVNEPVAILSNESPNGHHWLGLRLIGIRSHRDAVGAKVRLRSAGREQVRQVKGGGSYLSSSDRLVHFGLGAEPGRVSVEITWPSGARQELTDLTMDAVTLVLEPIGASARSRVAAFLMDAGRDP